MERKHTYCRICEALCGLEVDVDAGRVVAVRPDPDHPVSQGFSCVKGIRMLDVHRDPDRVRTPQRRRADGTFEPISWAVAIAEIGEKLRRIRARDGAHAVGLYFGNPTAFSYSHALASQGFVRGLGTRNVFSAGSQDCNNKFVVARAMYGSSLVQPVPDLDTTRYFLCLGGNPAVSQMSFVHAPRAAQRLAEITRRGGQVVLVGPRRAESSAIAGATHVFVRPDTDAYLLAGILHVVAREGRVRREAIARHVRGLERLLESLARVDLGTVTSMTGVDAETITRIAHDFADADGACAYMSTGVNQGTSGALAYYLLNALNVLTGNLDRAGGTIVTEPPVDFARLMSLAGVERSRHRSRVGGFPQVLGTLPATIMADEILTPGAGQIRALFVTAGNPLLSCANERKLAEAFASLELLVTIDLYRNETGELAHYVLPSTDFFQREDFPLPFTLMQPHPHAQFTEAVARPIGEERPEWMIYADLARASGVPFLGLPFAGTLASIAGERVRRGARTITPAHLLEAMLAPTPARLSRLRASPRGVALAPNRPGSFLGRRVRTRDGRVDLAPPELVAQLDALESRAMRQRARTPGGSLLLFSKREKTSHNTWMHNVPSLVAGRRATNYAYMHPDDAAQRSLVEGARARIESTHGAIEVPVRLDPDVMPGTIAVPHGWGHARASGLRVARATQGVNVNVLAPDGPEHTEAVSGMTWLVGIPVHVERARGDAVAMAPS